MARLHSRKKGRSSSSKPVDGNAASLVTASQDELKQVIAKLLKEGKTEAQIGLVLRDEYGVPDAKTVFGKKLVAVIEELGLAKEYPSDLIDLIRKAIALRSHLEQNPRDQHNKTKLAHVESKIKRLVKYYRGKKLPKNWKYEPESAALLVK
jgi:small subunit ribosomal protein S15